MKRYGNLYDEICSFENLWRAARKAQRGKRFQPNVARFNYGLERELVQLREELLTQTYRPGDYHEFFIYEPKQRLISAAPYRDRVAHHALCNVIEPIFERTFISDSYACRKGKGTHAAVNRLQQFMQSNRYALKCDVRQYFPSIDHALLLDAIKRKIKCRRTLWLVETIISHGSLAPCGRQEIVYFAGDDLFTPHARRKGIPIGNQTSQFFANVYLNGFDHWMTETDTHINAHKGLDYLRYVDDFVILGNDKQRLHEVKEQAGEYLAGLRLRLHPTKCQVSLVRDGIEFLGYRVFPTHRRLRADNPRRYGRRLRLLRKCYAARDIDLSDVSRSIHAWIGHAQHADTKRLRADVFRAAVFCRG
jgi:retron-type reverse transcriptase